MQPINNSVNFLDGSFNINYTTYGITCFNDTPYFSNGSFSNGTTWNYSGGFNNPFKRTYFRAMFIVIYSVVFTLCIIGNSMVLFAIARSPRLRTMTNFLLANLAIADLSVGAFCILPNLFTFLQPNWILGKAMCKIYYYIWNVSYIASILVLTVIAVERYIAILHPLKARRYMINFRFLFLQICIWAIALVYNIPLIVFYDTISFYESKKEYCYAPLNHMESLKWLSLVNLILWYFLPLIIIGCIYYRVIKLLWKTTVVSAMRLLPYPESGNLPSGHTSSRMTNFNNESEQKMSSLKNVRTHSSDGTAGNVGQSTSSSEAERFENKVIFTFKGKHAITLVCGLRRRDEHSPQEIKCFLPVQPTASHSGSEERESGVNSRDGNSDTLRINTICSSEYSFRQSRYRQTYLSSSRRVTKARRKVIRLLICVVICFGVCVLPHMMQVLNHYWILYIIPHSVNTILSPIAFIVLYLKSVLNPFLYALFSTNFRRGFKEAVHCCRKRVDKFNAEEVK